MYIYLRLIFMVNVGRISIPPYMDPMGLECNGKRFHFRLTKSSSNGVTTFG